MRKSWLIGSGPGCDLLVKGHEVADQHCRLTYYENGFILEDLASLSGTFVNGERIGGQVHVSRHDEITLGRSTLMPWPEGIPGASRELRLGRTPENDLVIDLPMISSRHARVLWDGSMGQAWIEDTNSANGTSVGQPGRQTGLLAFGPADMIFFGSQPIAGAWLLARLGAHPTESLTFRGEGMTLGRDPASDAVFPSAKVSWNHARLFREGPELKIEDLGSSNGTFVNGRPISMPTVLNDGDLVGLGSHQLVLDGNRNVASTPGNRRVTQMETGEGISGLPTIQAPGNDTTRPLFENSNGLLIWSGGLLAQSFLMAMMVAAIGWFYREAGPDRVSVVDSWIALVSAWFGLSSSWVFLGRFGREKFLDYRTFSLADEIPLLALTSAASLIQCVLTWMIVASLSGLHASWAASMAVMILGSLGGLATGFLIVALLPKASHAAVAIVASMVFMVLLGAVQSPLRPMGGAGVVADATPSRWAFEGLILLEAKGSSSTDEVSRPDLAETVFPRASTRSGIRACVLALTFLIVGVGAAAAFIEWGPGERPRILGRRPDRAVSPR